MVLLKLLSLSQRQLRGAKLLTIVLVLLSELSNRGNTSTNHILFYLVKIIRQTFYSKFKINLILRGEVKTFR